VNPPRTLLTALVTLLCLAGGFVSSAPAQAGGLVLTDADSGFKLTIRTASQSYALRLDHVYSDASDLFSLSCGARRHGGRNLVLAIAPVSAEHTVHGDLFDWNTKKRFCDLTKTPSGSTTETPVASFHLKPPRR
jgi:hypothetical protein